MDAPAGTLAELDDAGSAPAGGLSLAQVLPLCLACVFLGYGLFRFLDRPRYPSASSATVGFLRDMHVHHEQALEMAFVEIRKGESAELRQMATEIVLTQRGEMVLMEDRLGAWGLDLGDADRLSMAWMGPGMAMPVRQMHGLATQDQIDELKRSSGRDTDALFVRLMTVHHGGGVEMADAAGRLAGDRWTARLARSMVTMQRGEILEMRGIAAKLGVTVPAIAMPGDASTARAAAATEPGTAPATDTAPAGMPGSTVAGDVPAHHTTVPV